MEFSEFLDFCGMTIITTICIFIGIAISAGIVLFISEAANEVKELFRGNKK